MHIMRVGSMLVIGCLSFSLLGAAFARGPAKRARTLDEYLRSLPQTAVAAETASTGSLWVPGSAMTESVSDYKARHVNDVVVVRIVEDTTATSSGSVATARSFSANSGVSALAGQIDTRGVESLFSPHSESALKGQGQSESKSMLRTSLAGQVVAVLPSGQLVIEAQRDVTVNNERQTVMIRGVARAGDIAPDSSVLSTSLSHLELELKGKGVISDSTRPPHLLTRLLLKILGF